MKKLAGKAFELAGKAVKGGSKAVAGAEPAAAKEAVFSYPNNSSRRLRIPPYAFGSSVVNTQLKSKMTPSGSSAFGKFFGIVDPSRSDVSKLISQFTKLYDRQIPGLRKDRSFEQKLMSLVASGKTIGIPELAKLLSR